MNRNIRAFTLCAILAGCAADEDLADLEDEAAATSTLCGEYGTHVASLPTPTGTTADFCVFSDDLYGIRESGSLDTRGYLGSLPSTLCADEIHARLAPGQRVPQALIEVCKQSTSTALALREDGEPDGLDTDGEFDAPPVDYSHYCSGDGDLEFEEERCSPIISGAGYDGFYDSIWWCITSPWSSVQKTASTQIGSKVNKLTAVVAACSGSTEVKLKAKVGGDWKTYIHDTVSGNYWDDWSLATAMSTYDLDMRFNAGSDDGWFRNAGYFGDFLWP